jgi:hypothetical protein
MQRQNLTAPSVGCGSTAFEYVRKTLIQRHSVQAYTTQRETGLSLLAPYILFDYMNLTPTNVHSLCFLTQLFIIKMRPTCFQPIFYFIFRGLLVQITSAEHVW